MSPPDAVVVGSGPNGLAAALVLSRAGLQVEVYEGASEPGGSCRTAELTLPRFLHDVCSAVHPLAMVSPFFATVDLAARGVTMVQPEVAFAHPLDGGRAGAVYRSLDLTADGLGRDGPAYRRMFGPLSRQIGRAAELVLGPLRRPPKHPVAFSKLAAPGMLPITRLARAFETEEARALLAGVGAHAIMPLSSPLTGMYGLLLTALAHSHGWPIAQGGSGQITAALVSEIEQLGAVVRTDHWVRDLGELPPSRLTLMSVSPKSLLDIAGSRLSAIYKAGLRRFRYGPGVCKVDWALSGPVPWDAVACRLAGTVHVGGNFEEIAMAESQVAAGHHPERPFCIVVQPTVLDPTRAPSGKHTLWAYCHVPNGSDLDMTGRIEAQIERFAPGFGDLVLARKTTTAAEQGEIDPNHVGGDINGGAATLFQSIFRPTVRWDNYRTSLAGLYICSASTPPGGGVHGMCGYWAARSALAELRNGASSKS